MHMNRHIARPIAAVCGLILLLSLIGCGKDLRRQNYETVYVGQPAWAVERAMGEPDDVRDGVWVYERESPYAKAVIEFDANDTVIRKDWSVSPTE